MAKVALRFGCAKQSKNLEWCLIDIYYLHSLQGLPSGFDIMYLAVADRNMQVRFGLKVVWEF